MARLVGDEGEAAAAKQLRAREDQIAQLDKDNYYYRQSNKCGPRDARPARAARRGRCMPPQTRSVPSFACDTRPTAARPRTGSPPSKAKGQCAAGEKSARKPTNKRTNEQTNRRTDEQTNNLPGPVPARKEATLMAQASEPASRSRFCNAGS
jgi:hypothetical protein